MLYGGRQQGRTLAMKQMEEQPFVVFCMASDTATVVTHDYNPDGTLHIISKEKFYKGGLLIDGKTGKLA